MMQYHGELFDGTSTTPIVVVLSIITEGVEIRYPDGSTHIIPFREIRDIEKTAGSFRCTFTSKNNGTIQSQVLNFSHITLYREISEHHNATQSPLKRACAKIRTLRIWQLLIFTISILAVVISLFHTVLLHAYRFIPLSYDLHTGRSIDSTLSNYYEQCNTPQLDTFLQKAVHNLTLVSDRFAHRVIILNDSTKNAIAVPGGTIYLYRGLLETSNTPDEILGVLSHEIAHSERRHTVRQIIQSMGVGYIISLTVGIAIDGFDMLEGLESTLEMSSVLFMLRYSRSFESEADSLAITRLHNAHIKVGPLDTLLTRISPKPRSRDRILELFSTHPFTKERTEKFQKARVLETFSPDTIFSFERAHWNEIKKGCPAPNDSTPLWKKILR